MHPPATQTFPPEQAAPHAPQLLLSVWVATQVSPQRTVPLTHSISLDDRQPGSSARPARRTADRAARMDGVMEFPRKTRTARWKEDCAAGRAAWSGWRGRPGPGAVSYTHLTLPT